MTSPEQNVVHEQQLDWEFADACAFAELMENSPMRPNEVPLLGQSEQLRHIINFLLNDEKNDVDR